MGSIELDRGSIELDRGSIELDRGSIEFDIDLGAILDLIDRVLFAIKR